MDFYNVTYKSTQVNNIINDLKSKYNLKEKDFFSASMCMVKFLEFFEEEGMIEVMYDCPDRFTYAHSDNRRACAAALKAEQKNVECSSEEQCMYYIESVQGHLSSAIQDGQVRRFFSEFEEEMDTCYRKEIFIPFILGTDIDSFDMNGDWESMVNKNNWTITNIIQTLRNEYFENLRKKREEKRKQEAEQKKQTNEFDRPQAFIEMCDIFDKLASNGDHPYNHIDTDKYYKNYLGIISTYFPMAVKDKDVDNFEKLQGVVTEFLMNHYDENEVKTAEFKLFCKAILSTEQYEEIYNDMKSL